MFSQSRLAEELVNLYLRLNGYITTGFILHSANRGKNITEIDCIAVRFPHSQEPNTNNKPDDILRVPTNLIDVILCECKTNTTPSEGENATQLGFNPRLQDVECIGCVLRRIGIWRPASINSLAKRLYDVIPVAEVAGTDLQPILANNDVGGGDVQDSQVRWALFAPDRKASTRRNGEHSFFGQDEIFSFLQKCFSVLDTSDTCSRKYPYQNWGAFEPLVRFFKETQEPKLEFSALSAFVNEFCDERYQRAKNLK